MKLTTLLRLWYYTRLMKLHRYAYLRFSNAREWIARRIDHNGEQIIEYKQRMREERE